MPNVPIVTEVTKLELDALVAANGLNEGLQYKVTDKGWLLNATSMNTLTPIGEFIIDVEPGGNPILPSYIITEYVNITGNITTDISSETGEPYLFAYFVNENTIPYVNFIPTKILFDTSGLTDDVTNLIVSYDSDPMNVATSIGNTSNKAILFSGSLNGQGVLGIVGNGVSGVLKAKVTYIKI